MPRAALNTGMVDWVLPVPEIPLRLRQFLKNERRMHVPLESSGASDLSSSDAIAPVSGLQEAQNGDSVRFTTQDDKSSGGELNIAHVPSVSDENALLEVLRYLRSRTGHDFTCYKRATILRRVARRLQVNLLENIPSYLNFLRIHPAEVTALLHDLLINVTNFFRDKNAFSSLESYIPQLFAGKHSGDVVRVWVAACATGEEAYSVAMILSEHASRLESPPSIQIFATDLDEDVIQIARSGLYPSTIEVDVSPERLRRFFYQEGANYRIRKEVRELALFSAHNILKDPPFSRLDMITCRNLLIYLKREPQAMLFDIFHFGLRPGGLLFLGASEGLTDTDALFAPLDKSARIYVRRGANRAGWKIPAHFTAPAFRADIPSASIPYPVQSPFISGVIPAQQSLAAPPTREERKSILFSELHFSLLEQYAPPSVIVNDNYDIVHLSPNVGQFLQFSGGDVSVNLLKVTSPSVRSALRTALFRAGKEKGKVTVSGALMPLEGKDRILNIHVFRMEKTIGGEGFFLTLFDLVPEMEETSISMSNETVDFHLDQENQSLKEQLSAPLEQYEVSMEELKASYEEMQAVNEEMRSTTEELETGKEELQSINEELTTVNQELKSKVEELSRVNSDLQNLMFSTEIGTIFLDRHLNIKRFTPRVQQFFNVIPTDIGRPLSDITHTLDYPSLLDDARQVLRDLHSLEREVSGADHWFLARVLPYRTLDDHIDGIVLTFMDITDRRQYQIDIETLNRQLSSLNNALHQSLTETHHRVKNNLQVVSALVDVITEVDSDMIPRTEALRVRQHIQAMASIHDLLTQEVKADAAARGISVKELMNKLAPLLQQTVGTRQMSFDIEDVRLPVKEGNSLSIILNELVSNAVKHGRGAIQITLEAQNAEVILTVRDEGSGFPEGFDPSLSAHTGLELVDGLIQVDLQGGILYRNCETGGGLVQLTFPLPSL